MSEKVKLQRARGGPQCFQRRRRGNEVGAEERSRGVRRRDERGLEERRWKKWSLEGIMKLKPCHGRGIYQMLYL